MSTMPTINRKEVKPKKPKYKKQNRSEDFYASMSWKRLTKTFLSLHPLCSCCLSKGKIEPAVATHHIHPFLDGDTEEEQWRLFLDESNLFPTCNECHQGFHRKMERYGLRSCCELTDKEWKEAHHIEDIE